MNYHRTARLFGVLLGSLLVAAPSAFPAPYKFTTIDVPGAAFTRVFGINGAGQVVGIFGDTSGQIHGFLFSSGSFTTIDVPDAVTSQALGINNAGEIVGDSFDKTNTAHGFLLSGGSFTTIDVPGSTSTEVNGISNSAEIVGDYFAPPGTNPHGFLLSGGGFTTVDVPGASGGTRAQGINAAGQIVGEFIASNLLHGFLLSGGSFTTIDVPGAVSTVARGINDAGEIVGSFSSGIDGKQHGFLLSNSIFTTIDVSGAGATAVQGINALGQIVGLFHDDIAGKDLGFIGTPVNIQSVAFEAIDSPLDSNPNAGGGQRIVPDKQSPADTTNRKRVRVKATISPAFPDVTIFFRSFDVDDPSSDTAPIDSNGPNGDDNRGSPRPGTLICPATPCSAQTDSSGVAQVEFEVTMQPGDNFKVAASADQTYLNGVVVAVLDLRDAQGDTLPTDTAKATDMLTVWRRVHIEVDSMGLVAFNKVEGTIQSVKVNKKQNQTVLSVNRSLERSRFQNGRIIITNVGAFPVTDNSTSSVTVQGIVSSTAVGKLFTLVDDDDFNSNDGALKVGDDGENVTPPDTSLIQDSDNPSLNVFAPGYVRPIYDLQGNDDFVPFVLNTPAPGEAAELKNTYRFDNKATEADANFWTIYVLEAYQYVTSKDCDPDGEITRPGCAIGVADALQGEGVSIFAETIRELSPLGPACTNAVTTAHEVGHLFNADHLDGGIMGEGCTVPLSFSDISIDKIRRLIHP